MAENVYNWQFNTLPGNANQGAILMTRNDIQRPPFTQDDFIFRAMEDVIGVANCKLEYDEVNNRYKIFKATGHMDNLGNWTYNWEQFGTWDALTPEVVEELKNLKYVTYRFEDTTVDKIQTWKMYGVKKDGTEDLISTLTFVTKQYVDDVIENIKNILPGTAIEAVDSGNDRTLSVKYNTDDFSVGADNALKSELIKDNLETSQIKTWSIDKIKEYAGSNGFQYKGEVANESALPAAAAIGSVYNVIDKADLYVRTSDSMWKTFTQIAIDFTTYAIELHKSSNGLYAKLRYDSIDFTIDSLYNLKSQLINDTIDSSDPNANKKTYSVAKILSLLTSAMRYKGQVATYADLPATGQQVGDVYNVVDTGNNYAWNGTGWDNLAGEYIAGVGIQIQGKVISATGINFNVGAGIQIVGTGENAKLETRIANGIEYVNVGTTEDPVYAMRVKGGNGVDVNASGVNVTVGNTTQIVSDKVEVKPYQGIVNTTSGLSTNNGDGITFDANDKITINTNLATSTTPLGTNPSGFVLHSDGKLEVQAGVIQPEFIGYMSWNRSNNLFSTLNSDIIKRHNLLFITLQLQQEGTTVWINTFSNVVSADSNAIQRIVLSSPTNPYQRFSSGEAEGWMINNMELEANTISGSISQPTGGKWKINSWSSGSPVINWVDAATIYSSWQARIVVYGI